MPYRLAISQYGAARGTQTPDLLITSQLLFHLSYNGMKKERVFIPLRKYSIKKGRISASL